MERSRGAGRRLLGLALVFGMGIAFGALMVRLTVLRPVSLGAAQRRALAVLDRQPVTHPGGDNRIVEAVRHIEPAVVNIDTVSRARAEEVDNAPWRIGREVRGKGSGVVLTSDGYIVTNKHVIEDATRIRVTLPGGQWYYARKIGVDPYTDLAVVRINACNLPIADLGDSNQLQVGEWTIAVGNPLGLGSTITVGVISALNRRNLQIDEGRNLDGAIQTDAAINRGNSGGALANTQGQLVGINTAILSSGPNGGSIGLGFAIPANTVRRVVREIIQTGKASTQAPPQPWLGIEFGAVPDKLAQKLALPDGRGVFIRRTLEESPAREAGLRDGDIILTIDGKEIGDLRDVREAVTQRRIGEQAMIHVLRPDTNRELDIAVRVQDKPENISLTPLP
jgi:S1-C subfamily serine protease